MLTRQQVVLIMTRYERNPNLHAAFMKLYPSYITFLNDVDVYDFMDRIREVTAQYYNDGKQAGWSNPYRDDMGR
jgi:chitinase